MFKWLMDSATAGLGSPASATGAAAAAAAEAPTVQFGRTKVALVAATGGRLGCVASRSFFGLGSETLKTELVKEERSPEDVDGLTLCFSSVSSSDADVRFGDVVTVWTKRNGGLCMCVDRYSVAGGASARHAIQWQPKDTGEPCWFLLLSAAAGGGPDTAVTMLSRTWQCAACTTVNQHVCRKCVACETPRPAPRHSKLHYGDRLWLVPIIFATQVLCFSDADVFVAPLDPAFSGLKVVTAPTPAAVPAAASAATTTASSTTVRASSVPGAAPGTAATVTTTTTTTTATSLKGSILAAGAISLMKHAVPYVLGSDEATQRQRQQQQARGLPVQPDPYADLAVAATPVVQV
jgi:hypothetical protein